MHAWVAAIEANPSDHDAGYGYAEFCLFLDDKERFGSARQAMLSKFGTTSDPYLCERIARACLLRDASEDELRQAVELAERAVAVDARSTQACIPISSSPTAWRNTVKGTSIKQSR